MKPLAYSYIRFSTAEQLKGKSLERQDERAVAWSKQHGIPLDTELTLRDLGVSAFRGKNADTGALGLFLRAVHAGQVPKGSFLLIETFDRLSRESAYDAQLTLQNIINDGITVVTLMDGKQYNVSILRADPFALIYSILLMSRSHEESATKSKRVADAWRRKRAAIAKGVILTRRTPSWIKVDQHGKFQLVPRHVKTVQLIFDTFLSGVGYRSIAAHLNEKNIPPLRGAKYWHYSFVRRVLLSRAVLGEFQPHCEDSSSRSRKRIPQGDPIKNYYPSIIKQQMFDRAQKQIRESTPKPKVGANKQLRNILSGVARCSICGGLMLRQGKQTRNRAARLRCPKAYMGAGCTSKTVSLLTIETTIIASAANFVTQIPVADEGLQDRIGETEIALREQEAKIADLALLLDGTPSRVIAERIRVAEGACEKLKLELEAMQLQAQHRNVRRIKESAIRLKEALQWHEQTQDVSNIANINTSIRECFSQIVVNIEQRTLGMHWKHGGVAVLKY